MEYKKRHIIFPKLLILTQILLLSGCRFLISIPRHDNEKIILKLKDDTGFIYNPYTPSKKVVFTFKILPDTISGVITEISNVSDYELLSRLGISVGNKIEFWKPLLFHIKRNEFRYSDELLFYKQSNQSGFLLDYYLRPEYLCPH